MTGGSKVALGLVLVGTVAFLIFTLDTSQPNRSPAPSSSDQKQAPASAVPKTSWNDALSASCTHDLAKAGFSVQCTIVDDRAVIESRQMNKAMANRIMRASWTGSGDVGDTFLDMWKDGGITTVTFTSGSGFHEEHAIQ